MAERRAVEIDYPLAAVTAFAALIALPLGKRFRFLYLSGMIAERDQMKRLWYMQDARWLKGEVENKLLDFTKPHDDAVEAVVVKPGMVLAKNAGYLISNGLVGRLMRSIRVDELAAVMVDTAMLGADTAMLGAEKQVMEYDDLVTKGRALLR